MKPGALSRRLPTWKRFPQSRRQGERAVTTDIAGKRLRTKNFQTKSPGVIKPMNTPYVGRKRYRETAGRRIGGGFSSRRPSGRAWVGDIAGRRLRTKNQQSPNPNRIGGGFPMFKNNASRRPGSKGQGIFSFKSRSRSWNNQGKALPVRQPKNWNIGLGRNRGKANPGGGSRSGSWNNNGKAIQGKQPGMGAFGINLFRGNLKGRRAAKGGGSVSGMWNNRNSPIPVRTPKGGLEVNGFGKNALRARRPAKGGGSVSGMWNNKNNPIPVRTPRGGLNLNGVGKNPLRARGPLKGGGSVSGKLWNNRNSPIPVRTPRGGFDIGGTGKFRTFKPQRQNQGEEFAGFKRGRRPLKGGGSVSGKLWNNRNAPIPVRTPRGGMAIGGLGKMAVYKPGRRNQGEEFSGYTRSRRMPKGGGSVSGRLWNNRNSPIPVRTPKGGLDIGGTGKTPAFNVRRRNQGEEFSGYSKARRPVKGGGSVSGKLWNNRNSPIPVRTPKGGMDIGGFGKTRMYPRQQRNQGEEFTGFIRAKRPAKGGGSVSGKLWNNNQSPIPVRTPKSGMQIDGTGKQKFSEKQLRNQGEEFTGFWKRSKYLRNKNANAQAMLKKKPSKETYEVSGLQIRTKRRDYVKNKNSNEYAQLKLSPTRATRSTNNIYGRVRQYKYVTNRSSDESALKVREPGRAFGKATDYQGNIKMAKFTLFSKNRNLHPDARFVKTNKNNVDEERGLLTNFKLWWARLFRKNENQPAHLKDKRGKPRYDKGEAGMWNE